MHCVSILMPAYLTLAPFCILTGTPYKRCSTSLIRVPYFETKPKAWVSKRSVHMASHPAPLDAGDG